MRLALFSALNWSEGSLVTDCQNARPDCILTALRQADELGGLAGAISISKQRVECAAWFPLLLIVKLESREVSRGRH